MAAEGELRHYTVEPLGTGVFAALARADGLAVCNSGVVDLGGGGAVFDTGMTPGSARELGRLAEHRLGRPASLAVVSHFHLDHSLGNQEFASVPIWGTDRTRAIMLERVDRLAAELKRDELEAELARLEARLSGPLTEGARTDALLWQQFHRAALEASGRVRVVPPDRTFESRLVLPGTRGAELLSLGPGHTAADALLYLPREKILFAGDLVTVGIQPSMGSGDPEHWRIVLDELLRLAPKTVVPGHGPVSGPEAIEATRSYLSGVLEAAAAHATAPLPAVLRPLEGSESLLANVAYTRGWLSSRDAATS